MWVQRVDDVSERKKNERKKTRKKERQKERTWKTAA